VLYLDLIWGIVARAIALILLFLLINFLITEYVKISKTNAKFKQEMDALQKEHMELHIQKLKKERP